MQVPACTLPDGWTEMLYDGFPAARRKFTACHSAAVWTLMFDLRVCLHVVRERSCCPPESDDRMLPDLHVMAAAMWASSPLRRSWPGPASGKLSL
jgi:hypothetical protein